MLPFFYYKSMRIKVAIKIIEIYSPLDLLLSITVSCLLSRWLSRFPPNEATHESAELERARILVASFPEMSERIKQKSVQ